MKKIALTLVSIGALMAASSAQASTHVSVGFGLPFYSYAAPARVAYYAPAPVYYRPAPYYYRPVTYYQPAYYGGNYIRYYNGGYGHEGWHRRHWY